MKIDKFSQVRDVIIKNKILFIFFMLLTDVFVILIGSNLFTVPESLTIVLNDQGFLLSGILLEKFFIIFALYISIPFVFLQGLLFLYFAYLNLCNLRDKSDSSEYKQNSDFFLIIPMIFILIAMFGVPFIILSVVYLVGDLPALYLFKSFYSTLFLTKLLLGVFLFLIRAYFIKIQVPKTIKKLLEHDEQIRHLELKEEEKRIELLKLDYKLQLKSTIKPLLSQLLLNQEIGITRVAEVLSSSSDPVYSKVNEPIYIRSIVNEFLDEHPEEYEFIVLNESIRKII